MQRPSKSDYQECARCEIVTRVSDTVTALGLPCGTVVGDTFGGRTFTDNIAAILERRSFTGWTEFADGDQKWTVIVLQR
jgi:hypothetical protein